MRIPILLTLALAPLVAGAQGIANTSLRLAPQAAGYLLDLPTGKKQLISEIAVPIALVIPMSSRLSFDVATAYAQVLVKTDEEADSKLNGLTDTQVRLNYAIGANALVVTVGVNIPSGQYKVGIDEIAAAGSIGNDFFAFPISSFGNGLGATGGVAAAKALGAWNFGIGASFRKTQEFDAFTAGNATTTFEPGDEVRVRLGVDRQIFSGRVTVGGIYSKFGDDTCDGCEDATPHNTYSSGDRIIGQLALDLPAGPLQFYAGGWVLHHAKGDNVHGKDAAPPENILDGTFALGINAGSVLIEPNVEGRIWSVDGKKAGNIAYAGLRLRFGNGAVQISPSIAVGLGSLQGATTADKTDLTGVKGGLSIRIGG